MNPNSSRPAILALADGTIYEGYSFGAAGDAYGEVVFNTSMTGYQEMLTDPSYGGQIVVPTYPLVGNYGINASDVESRKIQVRGFVVREDCYQPSHWQSEKTLHQYLQENGIPGIGGIDTRALTRKLRITGVMMGMLSGSLSAGEMQSRLAGLPDYDNTDFVNEVSVKESYRWQDPVPNKDFTPAYMVVAVDLGLKYNILRLLQQHGCSVTVVPVSASAGDILKLQPDGILFSPGPGNPALLGAAEETLRQIVGKKPIMGICLGHQLLGRVFEGNTFKLKFGHRGANHPVKDLLTGRVHITAQNHGFAVDADSIKGGLEVSHVNLNDGTVEGFVHRDLPILSIQYHSEASPGPMDNVYLFERFVSLIKQAK
ncbi:MAG: glutamine-hydrolyzing carbamoyl-phosphate synthase small subunit [Dehalococcoidia bacterium]|nr:glutamine-hydrolyzing carbamoyl-phosphate synthase small subunit [Dehalococcoidia bacterium]MDZ4246700.1 glutamine-hydrolyzing carbamoyl-phosphate synthase small subunit [Dehalococcoidia bacterium]